MSAHGSPVEFDDGPCRINNQEIDISTHYDRLEPLAIQMQSLEYAVGSAYGLLLEHVGAIHILGAGALEAHINIRADQLLAGRERTSFERLAIDAKWLFLPRLLGLPGFDPGTEPLQGFDRLIRIRNRLVHYRPEREEWTGSAAPPEFLVKLGLTLEAADESLRSVARIIRHLATQLKEPEPPWLAGRGSNFFELEADP